MIAVSGLKGHLTTDPQRTVVSPTSVRLDNVSFRYSGSRRNSIDKICLDLSGGVIGLVGANGAGKSTLLGVISGHLRPTQGVVEIPTDNRDLPSGTKARTMVSLMPQEFDFPERVTVQDVLRTIAWLRGVAGRDLDHRVSEALFDVDLEGQRKQKVAHLSGGMRRRLALAQALVSRPDVLLLDEPTTGLDPEQRMRVRALIANASARERVTVLSSHIVEDVADLCNRVIVLHEGKVVRDASLPEFLTGTSGETLSPETAYLQSIRWDSQP